MNTRKSTTSEEKTANHVFGCQSPAAERPHAHPLLLPPFRPGDPGSRTLDPGSARQALPESQPRPQRLSLAPPPAPARPAHRVLGVAPASPLTRPGSAFRCSSECRSNALAKLPGCVLGAEESASPLSESLAVPALRERLEKRNTRRKWPSAATARVRRSAAMTPSQPLTFGLRSASAQVTGRGGGGPAHVPQSAELLLAGSSEQVESIGLGLQPEVD